MAQVEFHDRATMALFEHGGSCSDAPSIHCDRTVAVMLLGASAPPRPWRP